MDFEGIMDQIHEEMLSHEETVKNRYIVMGDVTTMLIERKNEDAHEVLIDTADIDMIRNRGSWHVLQDNKSNNFYVVRNRVENGKKGAELLHRFIMDNPKGMVIDHINHDTLNNRRSNLRAVTHAENLQNRQKASKNSKTGILGVSFHKASKRWQAKLIINKETVFFEFYDDIKEAEKAIIEARKQYMPYAANQEGM